MKFRVQVGYMLVLRYPRVYPAYGCGSTTFETVSELYKGGKVGVSLILVVHSFPTPESFRFGLSGHWFSLFLGLCP